MPPFFAAAPANVMEPSRDNPLLEAWTGRFGLPPARVEALYAPENHGELPLAPFEVRP